MILSSIIFVIAYIFIASEKVNKTIVAILGAGAVLFFNLIPHEVALAAIDLDVIFLIIGMMISVYVLSNTGFFEWIAVSMAKKTKGSPHKILLYLTLLTALLSALLDNVTTVVLLAPITILITQILEISAVPFLILEVIASNIGGTATLIGDPPNIIIGSQANLTFNAFLQHLSPIAAAIVVSFCMINLILFRKSFNVPEKIKLRLSEAVPHLAIVDLRMMIKALIVVGFVMLGFLLHHQLHLKPSIIALVGAAIMMLITSCDCHDALKEVEWGVIFFFIGLFIMIAALEHNGVINLLADIILKCSADNLLIACFVVLWGSAFISSVLDNIPFVIAMVPLVKGIIPVFAQSQGIDDPIVIAAHIAQPLWWSLALGACLGGNGTLIGASANIVVAHIGHKNNEPISFGRFMKYGIPYMIFSLILSSIYIYIRYFYFR